MKNNLLSLAAVLLLFLAQTSHSQSIPSYVPQNGLVGWWPFNGNANDESGNGNNGTVNGATLTTDRFGNENKAYSFDGVSNQIQVADANILDFTNSYSLSGWYLTNNPQQLNQTILGKGREFEGTGYHLLVNTDIFGNSPPKPNLQFGFNDGNSVNRGAIYPTNSNNLSGWHLLTGTYDGSTAKLYLDGELVANSDIIYSLRNSNEPLLIGNETNGLGRFFNGKLDDIAIWNRALSEQEIKNLYNANICYQNVTVTDTLLINMNITGFNPITYQNTIKIYPNPTQGNLTIDFGNISFLSGYQMKITNSVGQQVFQTNITQKISNVNLSSFTTKGIYYVQLIDSKGKIAETKKIVVQ